MQSCRRVNRHRIGSETYVVVGDRIGSAASRCAMGSDRPASRAGTPRLESDRIGYATSASPCAIGSSASRGTDRLRRVARFRASNRIGSCAPASRAHIGSDRSSCVRVAHNIGSDRLSRVCVRNRIGSPAWRLRCESQSDRIERSKAMMPTPSFSRRSSAPPWGKGGLDKVKASTWGALYFLWRTSPALSKLRLCTRVRCRDNVNRAWTRAAQNANLARDMPDYLLPMQRDMPCDLRLD